MHAPNKTEHELNDFEEFTAFKYAPHANKLYTCITIEWNAETRPDYMISGLVHRHVLKKMKRQKLRNPKWNYVFQNHLRFIYNDI